MDAEVPPGIFRAVSFIMILYFFSCNVSPPKSQDLTGVPKCELDLDGSENFADRKPKSELQFEIPIILYPDDATSLL
jgi:hypothetical protein